jgi:hypothetical protein
MQLDILYLPEREQKKEEAPRNPYLNDKQSPWYNKQNKASYNSFYSHK